MAYQPVIDGTHVPRAAIEMVADGCGVGRGRDGRFDARRMEIVLADGSVVAQARPHRPRRAHEPPLTARSRRRASSILTRKRARSVASPSRPPNSSLQSRPTAFSASRACASRKSSRRHDCARLQLSLHLAVARDGRRARLMPRARTRLRLRHQSNPGHARIRRHRPRRRKARDSNAGRMAGLRTHQATQANESTGKWKPYDEASRATMVFGASTKLEDAPRDEERRAWDASPRQHLRLALEIGAGISLMQLAECRSSSASASLSAADRSIPSRARACPP